MQTLRNFKEMATRLQTAGRRYKVVVACGYDDSTLTAAARAVAEGFAEMLFVGDKARTQAHPAAQSLGAHAAFLDVPDCTEAARAAVQCIRAGEGDILMKGLLGTDVLLRAILDKERGILPQGRVMTHVAAAQVPALGRLLFLSDAAVIPYPTHEQRKAQIGYVARICRAFGIDVPRISLLHCSEKPSDKFPHTAGYPDLIRRAERGEWGPLIVDGPLDLRTSCNIEGCRIKGISSPLEGRADALIFPDIEAANAVYKALPLFAGADMAGILQGPLCPVVLPSRGDNARTKYYSMAMAAVCSR